MLDIIVEHTNCEIEIRGGKYKTANSTIAKTCKDELRALIGLLILSGTLKNKHLGVRQMFDTNLCGSRYKACMSADRFEFLLNCLRFDDKETRLERRREDSFAPIREIWDTFIENCRKSYKAGSFLKIDEQLLAFRGRCPFRMFIPSKPAKYGIKIVMMCDVGTNYMIDASPYLGKSTNTNGMSLGEHYVKTLTKSIHGSNRNITMDNWFTSVKLISDLLEAPYNLTAVGTLRANKREIPPEMLNQRKRKINTSMFCYDRNITFVSYKPKVNKVVLLLSSTHETPTVNQDTHKPEIVEFYNSTKGAVDTLDQMCSNSSVSRKTKRWPLCIFLA